ncbi:MAG: hypothetical protein PWP15_1623 [Methanothermococcus sp.]|uniref:helicase-related protein n=1 Tax=Methanothermococcus TaxID=155862 RepID=UPI000362FEC8|nr:MULTISPECIES: helicase-related protein [Methanothermococcus]MDK2791103.1 hypothetical protein [Methanothermococcus sp.]MDK2977348.1 hypothetical protein [Bacteroidales bacterium]
MNTDLSFLTNEKGNKLVDRFSILLKDTKFFDCLVGYFYASGFYALYKSLENTEKIRILVGINTDKKTFDLIQEAAGDIKKYRLSFKEVKENFSESIISEMETSEDSCTVEEGIKKFIEWLKSGKLEIRVYPKAKIHAKLYIMSFKEGDRDKGRVITGSSNFTRSGLVDNLEFNVELKTRSDYEFALNKFNELWEDSVDVSEEYVRTVNKKTWLNEDITPYELYLKFLYEYMKEKINLDLTDEFESKFRPDNFMDLKYQRDAVQDAKLKLEEYGGVFISDVVGLGKTYIATMLVQQLGGETLVIAPPVLIDERNPGSWKNAFYDFGVRGRFVSRGNLDMAFEYGIENFKNIIIDESHYFRNESTEMYEKLFRICSGKRVILVSATPLNNKPMDILAQIKLFQNVHNSTLPNPKVRDLEKFFKKLDARLKGVDRRKDKEKYMKIVQENAKEIRENVLQYLMVRRTRKSIEKYYSKDLEKQGLKFPEVQDPKPVYYEFDEKLDSIFEETLNLITKELKYARYTPMLYYKGREFDNRIIQPQKNMAGFMKTMLLKRLESSFHAFKMSINRFIGYYEKFIAGCEDGNVYISKKHLSKVFEFQENDDEESIEKLISEGKVEIYPIKDFEPKLIDDLKYDLEILKHIKEMWSSVDEDPKLDKLIDILETDDVLKDNKVIIFTESEETAKYLERELNPLFNNKVLAFSGTSDNSLRKIITENFDGKSKVKKDEYMILISTEVLSEGVNLHRSNVVINYDIPWNPSRMMQRVGRINRVDSKFDKIYIYNFFPATKINENMGLKEAAEAKIRSFIEMLGTDSRLLTDEDIKSFDLFSRLNSKETVIGEDEDDPELAYLAYLRDIRDNDKELFDKIKNLPKKARTAKKHNENYNSLITFFKKGKMRKIYQTTPEGVKELDFYKAAEILKADIDTKKMKIGMDYYAHLDMLKKEFNKVFEEEHVISKIKIRRSRNESKLIKLIKAIKQNERRLTDDDVEYLDRVLKLIEIGGVSKNTIKTILDNIKKINNNSGMLDLFKMYNEIKKGIPYDLFQKLEFNSSANIEGPKEIILSEYLVGK